MISCSVVPPVGGWYSVFMVGADWQMESYLSNLIGKWKAIFLT